MDFTYPLRYEKSSVQIATEELPIVYSQTHHFLETFKGERYLQPEFGIDSGLLFDVDIPELLEQNIAVDINQVIPSTINYQISTAEVDLEAAKITLRIDFLSPRETYNQIANSIFEQFQFSG